VSIIYDIKQYFNNFNKIVGTLNNKKDKVIPLTVPCEMSSFAHLLDSWFTDGSEVLSITHRPPLTPRKILGTYFC
jgi:hypothetical protein